MANASPAPHASGPLLNPLGYLATQDLKERGWTPRLIANFLGPHDLTRPNGLKMGRRHLPPVKLYLEVRVEEAERQENFLLAQHRAMQARERSEARRAERARLRAERLTLLTEGYRPAPAPAEGLRKGAVRKARAPHLEALERALAAISAEFGRGDAPTALTQGRTIATSGAAAKRGAPLSEAETKALRATLQRRLDIALAQLYPWFPHPDADAKGRVPPAAQPSDWRQWDWD